FAGYYDGTIFHRVVPEFIVQGGDPTGSGTGGESIYGRPFKDEFHSRLRFNRRGLVAMANAGPHDNGSQFFFTLGRADELNNKHTIFGKRSCIHPFLQTMKGKSKSSHDLLKDDPKLSSVPVVDRNQGDDFEDAGDDSEDDSDRESERERIRENISQKLKRDKTDEQKTNPDTVKKTSRRYAIHLAAVFWGFHLYIREAQSCS
ncbi:peptidyl-prolyl cis-trans isomerase CWC27 homolog, partial [Sinocyclocheilus grahami]|uniref:peptidyl-prolyl cis-trans isomerase CWC27 homolog n=1 Tax=Sinocyclocheilus grahami TaxID=75366 RepID=UPI0007AD32A7